MPIPFRPRLSRSRWLPLLFGFLALGLLAASTPAARDEPVSATSGTPAHAKVSPQSLLAAPDLLPEAQTRTVTLMVSAPEPRLREGTLETVTLSRNFVLRLSPQEAEGQRAPASLESVYRQIEARTPQDVRFVQDDARTWTARAQTGWKVDRALTDQRLKSALSSGADTIRVAVTLTPPARTVRDLQAAGVVRHVGSGVSSFAGSPDFRIHNVRVGSSRLNGRLLKPGEVLDFNRSMGNITAERGFVPGYVISGNALRLEDGGGICQVSTTIFRAAYNAGLEIVERHAHSHQVAYYDPPGFEATVYAPNLNLRLRNDMAGNLLIQASWDLKAQTLRFDLFGPRRREVTVSEPRLSALRPARPPGFMPDAALKPGQAVRVDMPAQGMNVQIVRQVRGDDGTLRTDRTLSSYRPWGGVFAVHPSDARLKD